jgi:hypothetical protein
VPVHNRTLDRRRLNEVLRHVGWSQIGTTRLRAKLSLDIDSLFEENTLEKRVLVSKH